MLAHQQRFPVIVLVASLAFLIPSGSAKTSLLQAIANSPLRAAGRSTVTLNKTPFDVFAGSTLVGPQLTCSPAPCVFPNSQASVGQKPVNEPSIAVDPMHPMRLITGANDRNCPGWPLTYGGGFYTSTDGGATWTRSCSTVPPGYHVGSSDPTVAYDLTGAAYRAGCEASIIKGVLVLSTVVSKSIDNGMTWGNPVVAVAPSFAGKFVYGACKPWVQIDTSPQSPHRNRIYISALQFNFPTSLTQITVSRSLDGGNTWLAPVPDGPAAHFPAFQCCAAFAIGNGGTVYNTWLRCVTVQPQQSCGGGMEDIILSKSLDGGNTWSNPTTVHQVVLTPGDCFMGGPPSFGCLPNTNEPLTDYPAIARDNSSGPKSGTLYLVDYTYVAGHAQVQVSRSSDGGTSWSSPVAVAPRSDQHDQFFPWISVSPNGAVGVTWLDRRNDPANVSYDAFAAVSTDGGHTFANYQLSAKPSNPKNDGYGGNFMGDYTQNAWAGKFLYAAWPDTSNGKTAQDMIGGVRIP